jgi:hypothetical protein
LRYCADIHWKKLWKTNETSEQFIYELRYDGADLTNMEQKTSDKRGMCDNCSDKNKEEKNLK